MERQIADDCAVQFLQEEVDDLLGKVADDLGFDNIADLRKVLNIFYQHSLCKCYALFVSFRWLAL